LKRFGRGYHTIAGLGALALSTGRQKAEKTEFDFTLDLGVLKVRTAPFFDAWDKGYFKMKALRSIDSG